MDVKIEKRTANLIELKVSITHQNDIIKQYISSEYLFGTVNFQLQVDCACTSVKYFEVISARYLTAVDNDNLLYKCSLKLFGDNKKPMAEVNFTAKEFWNLIFRHRSSCYIHTFYVIVQFDLETHLTPFASLYEDTELTDFTLKAEDGSVPVHSTILAGYSPVLKKMLTGNWQETSDRSVTIVDATKETLEHFKEYMYLDKLPETGLDKLLLIGSCYLITDLVQKCNVKILFSITHENIFDFIEFTQKNKFNDLLAAILKIVDNSAVDLDILPDGCWRNVLLSARNC